MDFKNLIMMDLFIQKYLKHFFFFYWDVIIYQGVSVLIFFCIFFLKSFLSHQSSSLYNRFSTLDYVSVYNSRNGTSWKMEQLVGNGVPKEKVMCLFMHRLRKLSEKHVNFLRTC